MGRAGYGASLEGIWPYSYDTCDIGTVANQSVNGEPKTTTSEMPKSPPIGPQEDKQKSKGLKKYKEGAEKVLSIFQSPR